MGILLGLAASLNWGVADFMARFATRRAGAYRTLLFMQLVGFLALSAALAGMGGWGRFFGGTSERIWVWAVLAGLLNTGSSLSLYRSFEVGVLALVSPIAASYPALTVVLSLLSGENLRPARAAGVATAIVGVILAAMSFSSSSSSGTPVPERPKRRLLRGVPWAIGAAVGYGLLFWVLGFRVMPALGGFASVWVIRATTFGTLAVLAMPLGQDARLPRGNSLWLIVGIGLIDTAAFIANNLALKQEQVAVASVLSSLYGAVTVLLAAVFLRERLERSQWAGVCLIFLGVALVSV